MIKIPTYVNKVLSTLEDNGFEGYLVGGCVRDALLGIEVHDYDMCTNAFVEESKKAFSDFSVIPTGEKHGTLTILSDSHPIELTTYRVDGSYLDNRHPSGVTFTRNLHEDLSRRDFTINALAYNPKLGLVDDFDGIKDLQNKTIRAVGDPDARFNEDALRILRALRFSATLDFCIDIETANSIHKNAHLLKNISVERIYSELKRLILGKGAAKVLLDYNDVLCVIIPEFKPCVGFDQMSKYHCYDVYTHIIKTVAECPLDAITRLGALFHDIAKPLVYTQDGNTRHFKFHAKPSAELATTILKRLKVDNATINAVTSIIALHDNEIISKRAVLRTLGKIDLDTFNRLIELKIADRRTHAPEFCDTTGYKELIDSFLKEIEADKTAFKITDLDINGYDLMELGYQGTEIKKAQQLLLDAVIDEKIQNNKPELIDYLSKKDYINVTNKNKIM